MPKTNNNISICFGATVSGSTVYNGNNYIEDVTNKRSIRHQSYDIAMYSSENVPYITPIMFFYEDTHMPLKHEDGSFDTIDGLYMSGYKGFLVRENAMFSFANLYSSSTDAHTLTSIMAEF